MHVVSYPSHLKSQIKPQSCHKAGNKNDPRNSPWTPQAIMSAHWGQTAWVSSSSPQSVPHHRELLPLLGHRIKGGSKSFLALAPEKLPLGGLREEQSPPQED